MALGWLEEKLQDLEFKQQYEEELVVQLKEMEQPCPIYKVGPNVPCVESVAHGTVLPKS